jgi:uncharacterized Zn-finger protein
VSEDATLRKPTTGIPGCCARAASGQAATPRCREFKCIGDKPPQDHPHIYLNMGDASEILCPYCSTLFCFDPSLGVHEADPADCAYGDID